MPRVMTEAREDPSLTSPGSDEDIAAFLRDGRLFHQGDVTSQRVQLALYGLIAEGRPVPVERLADATGFDNATVARVLDEIPPSNFQYDDGGRILGFRGLSQVPSRHRLTFAGRELYAWCAFDCLFLPALLGGPVEVASACPVTRTEIRLTATPDGVQDMRPESVVMSFVMPDSDLMRADLRGTFCCHVNFFASEAAAQSWASGNPGAQVISLAEGFEFGRIRNQVSFGDVLTA